MRYVFLTAGLLLCPAFVVAQQPQAPTTLSLADAIALARQNNPAFRQALDKRGPASWAVRNAWASLALPTVTTSGGIGYSGPGDQRFLTANFSQSVATLSSNYGINLNWELSGLTLSQPGLRHAQDNATEADIAGATAALVNGVTQQYLTVLQARENAGVARKQLARNEEFLTLAQARYRVGQSTLLDVRQAQVARGQAEVALLRAETQAKVELLRLFEQLGMTAPVALDSVALTETFPVQAPTWTLNDLLTQAEAQNPSLQALRARARAATWGVRSAMSSFGPSLALSAGWAGFTQKFKDINPIIAGARASATSDSTVCEYENANWLNAGGAALPCNLLAWTPAQEQALRSQNSQYPFNFTRQPFSARLTISLPIWTNFSRSLQVSQAKADHQDLEESVRARGLAVQTEVSQAFLTVQSGYRAIAIQDTNRTAAQEQLQLATERYRVGSGTFFDLLDAQVQAQRAENDYISALYDYHKAVAALEAAVGRPLR